MEVNRKVKAVLFLLVTIVLLFIAQSCWAQDEEIQHAVPMEPRQITNELQASLLMAMRKGEKLSFQERFGFLAPVIKRSHHLDLIIRTALGGYWNNLSEAQQLVISDIFLKLSIATYAGRFKQYSGEQFEISQQRELPRNQLLIRSKLIRADKSTVDFDYIFQQNENGWKIINIIVDGVSDLALKRTEYRAVLKRDGFLALVDALKEKVRLAEQN